MRLLANLPIIKNLATDTDGRIGGTGCEHEHGNGEDNEQELTFLSCEGADLIG